MNKQTDINSLLAKGNRRQNQTPSLVYEHLDSIITPETKMNIKIWQSGLSFRFKDFKVSAKKRFCSILKSDSSYLTVQRMQVEEIFKRLNSANPVVAENYVHYGKTFYMGSFNRFREQRLSSLIYHLGKDYRQDEKTKAIINHLIS